MRVKMEGILSDRISAAGAPVLQSDRREVCAAACVVSVYVCVCEGEIRRHVHSHAHTHTLSYAHGGYSKRHFPE